MEEIFKGKGEGGKGVESTPSRIWSIASTTETWKKWDSLLMSTGGWKRKGEKANICGALTMFQGVPGWEPSRCLLTLQKPLSTFFIEEEEGSWVLFLNSQCQKITKQEFEHRLSDVHSTPSSTVTTFFNTLWGHTILTPGVPYFEHEIDELWKHIFFSSLNTT